MSVSLAQLNSTATAPSVRNSEGARRGTFTVGLHFFEPGNVETLKGLFDGMVVVHTETSHYEGVMRFYAVREDFEPVAAGSRTPEYVVMIDVGDGEEAPPRFFFERVSQETML